MFKVRVVFLLFLAVIPCFLCDPLLLDAFGLRHDNQTPVPEGVSADDALFLTPYIEKNQIEEGQRLAKVPPLMKNVESFSGYLTVNSAAGSNLFFWLFKSQQGNWEELPLVIRFPGGPGVSSLHVLFQAIGPFSVTGKYKLKRRNYAWNQKYNLLFIDGPVGSGFSFTNEKSAYARTDEDVAGDLYEALIQLHKLFPSLKKNKIIITGEGYAAKFIAATANKIYKMNKVSDFKMNLGGLMIGNGFTDPENMMHYSEYLYQVGIVDRKTRDKMHELEIAAQECAHDGKYRAANRVYGRALAVVINNAGFVNLPDIVHDGVGRFGPEKDFLISNDTRKAIHVGDYKFNSPNWDVITSFIDSGGFMRSARQWVEELLSAEEFPILFYNGNLNVHATYHSSVEFYNSLNWPRAKDYQTAKRCIFCIDGRTIAGYYKSAGTFTEVLVSKVGSNVPLTQPKWAFELLERFITNSTSFSECGKGCLNFFDSNTLSGFPYA